MTENITLILEALWYDADEFPDLNGNERSNQPQRIGEAQCSDPGKSIRVEK
jgi:hypothetical protein